MSKHGERRDARVSPRCEEPGVALGQAIVDMAIQNRRGYDVHGPGVARDRVPAAIKDQFGEWRIDHKGGSTWTVSKALCPTMRRRPKRPSAEG